jgi:UMF1 family MFS transporter
MMLVDVERGHAEGIALARTLEQLDAGHHDLLTQSNDSESDLS